MFPWLTPYAELYCVGDCFSFPLPVGIAIVYSSDDLSAVWDEFESINFRSVGSDESIDFREFVIKRVLVGDGSALGEASGHHIFSR